MMAIKGKLNLFDIFDKTYLINLPERKDRLKETEREIKWLAEGKILAAFEIFPAIRPESPGGWGSIGRRGSLLSHLECLQLAMDESGIDNVLLLEDDISFDIALKSAEVLDRISMAIHDDNWDFCYIGHNIASRQPPRNVIVEEHSGPILLAHCLAFNKRNLQPFIDFLLQTCERPSGHKEGGKMGFDGAINFYRKNNSITTLVISPGLAHQRSSRTDLGSEKWFDRSRLFKTAASTYRSAKNRLIYFKKRMFS